jgi:hypothetical protein
MLSRFLVLLALYMVVMFVGNMHFRADDVRLTGQHVRTLVAALQVTIVSALVFVHGLFMFFIRVVKQERTSFVLVSSRPAFTIDGDAERELGVDKDPELAEPAKEAGPGGAAGAAGAGGAASAAADDVSSMRIDARSEQLSVMSVTSDPLPLQIVFERSANLDLYFLYVTFVGLVLWCTFVSFNFATQDSNFVVVFGLVTGWIGNSLSRECHCHESRSEVKPGEKLRQIFYFSMALLILALGFANWSVPVDDVAALRVYVPAYCSGFFWTAFAQEVAFTGVQNLHVSKGILYDARRSLPTFMLVAMVSALSCSPETGGRVFEYIAALSRLAALHLLLVEPVLIYLSLYVMIIALERQRATDLAVVLVLVEGAYIAYRRETYDATVITTIAASVLLFGAHAGHLLRA